LPKLASALPVMALMLTLTISGCTSAPAATDTAAAASTAPEATPSTEVLNIEAAGIRYVSTLCVPNLKSAAYSDAFDNEELPFEELAAAAAEARDASQNAAQVLDDPFVKWPDEVADDIPVVRDMLLVSAGTFADRANGSSRDDVRFMRGDYAPDTDAAVQRIRLRLGLPADTQAGCEQYVD
jgi:murein L,D-transpeptidase YcbB/YkuD